MQIVNPFSVMFFGALFPRFLDPARALPGQLAILILTLHAIEFAGLFAYALLAAGGATRLRRALMMRIAGLLMIGAGLGLALRRVAP